MRRRKLLYSLLLISAASLALFGAGACCLFTAHRCAAHATGHETPPVAEAFTAGGISHDVYTFGQGGPEIILLHELPGLSLETVTLAKKLAAGGYTVHVPLIFGEFAGGDATIKGFGKCFSEFHCFGNGESHFAGWLRALIAQRYTGRNLAVVGMCLTGSVALEVADAPGVAAVVMAQPSLPLPLTRWQRSKIGMDRDRAKRITTPILAIRFSEDCLASRERFRTLREVFPANQIEFEEIDSKKCPKAHATLTGDFSPQAYAHLVTFLKAHLR